MYSTEIVLYTLSYNENLKRLIAWRLSDTYIESVLYARYNHKYSIKQIAEDIKKERMI